MHVTCFDLETTNMYTETSLPVFSDIRRLVSESSANLKVSLNLFAEIPPGALNGR